MSKIENLVNLATREVGVKESPINSNNVKYNTWYYGRAVSGASYPWCMAFVQWCFNENGTPLPYKTASCSALLNYYKQKDPSKIVAEPRSGDIVIYNFGHTGIVVEDHGDTIETIEGNTGTSSQNNGGEVLQCIRSKKVVTAYIRPIQETQGMNYSIINGIHIIEVPVTNCEFLVVNKAKKQAANKNYANLNYFGSNFARKLTIPVSFLKCNVAEELKSNQDLMSCFTYDSKKNKYVHNNTYSWDTQFNHKKQSALIIQDGKAEVKEVSVLPNDCDFAVGGIPVIRHGEDVIFKTEVLPQGWTGGELYGTYHTMIGLKDDPTMLYIIGMKTTSANMITSAEAYRKLKPLGFKDVLKMDGGGSHCINYNGKIISASSENRRINAIIQFAGAAITPPSTTANPYIAPTVTLKRGSSGTGVKWLQYQLKARGYDCGAIDGIFGKNTDLMIKQFQKNNNLVVDGLVGPATRKALIQ